MTYKIIDSHNYLRRPLDGRILRRLFEHERLKPASKRTSQGNFQNLAQLNQGMNAGLKFYYVLKTTNTLFKNYQYRVEILAFNTLND